MKHRHKGLLVLVLSLVMVLSTVVAASAADTYPVSIGGVQLTSENISGYEGISYDADNNTLTLDNFVYEGSSAISADGDLTIVLTENTINTVSTNGDIGISVTGNLTIEGDGSLTATGNTSGITATSVTINGGTVTAKVTSIGGKGISAGIVTIEGGTVTAGNVVDSSEEEYSAYGIYATSAITISGGTVNATGTDGIVADDGIGAGTVTISGGEVTATATNIGIYGGDTVTISGGKVEATATYAYTSNTIRGIYTHNLTISGGTVTATGDTYGIDTYSLKISGDSTEVNATGGEDGIYTAGSVDISSGTVNATGNNYGIDTHSLEISGDSTKVNASGAYSCGICARAYANSPGKVAISNGTVTATGGTHGIAADDATISGGTVIAKGTALTDSVGIYASGGYDGALTISGANTKVDVSGETGLKSDPVNILGGTVTAEGGTYGIYTAGSVDISSGTVNATGNIGIEANNLTIKGGTVNAESTASGAYSCGILGSESNDNSGNVAIKGGTVTATGGTHGIAADVATISGGTVTAEGDTTAIHCTELDMNDDSSVWYQWTNDKNATAMNTDALDNAEEYGKSYLQIAPPHAVFFNANGGTGTMDRAVGVSGSYTLPSCTFTPPAGKEFKGWATSADGEVISTTTYSVTGNTTLYAIWKSTTSPGGGYPGIPYVPTTPTEDKVTTPAQPTTPPAEVTVPVSGEENTINVEASVSGSTATIDKVDMNQLDGVIGDDVAVGTVTIDFSVLESTEVIDEVEIPAEVVKEIAAAVTDPNNDAESLEIVLSDGASIEFDAVALAEKAAQADGADITISIKHVVEAVLSAAQQTAVGDRVAFDINVTSGGVHISDMGGKITIHAPYELRDGETADGIVVYYVDDEGNMEKCETSYDSAKKRVNWKTDHLSVYMIAHEAPVADDTPAVDETPADDATQSDSANGISLWIGVALVVFVIAIVVVVIAIKRKKA